MRSIKLSLLVGVVAACSSVPRDAAVPPAQITLMVTSPTPGAELVAGDRPSITVSGMVATSDATQGALAAWVNGVQVDVHAGAFTAELPAEPGINHIKVDAGDGIADPVTQERDVMWVPEYLPPRTGETGFDLAGALELQLGQRFFDARLLGTTLDRSTDPVVARDVASALELILWHADLAGLLGGGIHVGQGGTALDITIPSVTPANIVVDARIVDGPPPAIELTIDLLGVALAMHGSLTLPSAPALAVDGGITADLHASARLTLGTAADGSIAVGVTGITASVGPLVPGFTGVNGDALDGIITAAGSSVRPLIEGLIADQLIPTFTSRLPPVLASLLGAADQLLDGIHFTLDTGLGTPVTLDLGGQLGALDVAAGVTAGHVTVRQDLTLRTSGTPLHAASRGAPRIQPLADPPVPSSSGVHLTLRQDFLNALLHALWNAGILDGDLSASGLAATVTTRLPPVIRPTPASSPCEINGVRCDVELQLGQVEVQLPAFEQSFAINASAGARIAVDGSKVTLVIQDVPELRVWETSTKPGRLTADAVRELVASFVWPKLFGAIGNNLTIALPLPDLMALGIGDLAPGLAGAQLVLEMRQRPSVTGGRIILGADLSLTAPTQP